MIENADPQTCERFPAIGLALCEACGLAHQNPRISENAMAAIYRSLNDKAFVSSATENSATTAENAKRLGLLASHLPGGLEGKRLLEIGSSNGAFLEMARSQGAIVSGIEPSADNAATCLETRGIEVFNGFLDEFDAPRPFDVICHYFVLEHAFDPVGFMRKARSMLAPGGHLFFEVPAIESFVEMPFAINLFPYQHISHFDRQSVGRLLHDTGFVPLVIEGSARCSKAYGMTLAARLSDENALAVHATDPGYGRRLLGEYFEKKSRNEAALRSRVEQFVGGLGRPTVAIYGAGENGRLLLRTTAIRSLCSILVFFDNSPAFIGTEVEGCPVFSPVSLPDLKLDAAVLASIDYQDDMERDLVSRGFPPARILKAYPPPTGPG
jgi:SAM-dependent methyltransferase